ncbi:MAG: hypothetical protein U0996_06285 [Planctomycetaceae bacterium]
MKLRRIRRSPWALLALGGLLSSGCISTNDCCSSSECCTTSGCNSCETCDTGCGTSWWPWSKKYYPASRYAIPDVMPLGAVSRAHWHMQETNGEAADFVIYRNEFVENSSELTPYGRDHIMEIAARMPSAPFPVIVQRTMNNSDPELDQIRRDIVVRVLTDLGNPDADRRTVVSQPYSNGINSMEAEQDYGRFRNVRGFNNFNGGFGGGGGGR